MYTKYCTACKREKPASEFYKSSQAKDGLYPRCKPCDIEAGKIYRAKHVERDRASRRHSMRRVKYGIEPDEFERRMAEQSDSCAICYTHVSQNDSIKAKDGTRSLCIDHDHETGRIRGLLCNSCNRALGLFKDDEDIIRSALDYLKEVQ